MAYCIIFLVTTSTLGVSILSSPKKTSSRRTSDTCAPAAIRASPGFCSPRISSTILSHMSNRVTNSTLILSSLSKSLPHRVGSTSSVFMVDTRTAMDRGPSGETKGDGVAFITVRASSTFIKNRRTSARLCGVELAGKVSALDVASCIALNVPHSCWWPQRHCAR